MPGLTTTIRVEGIGRFFDALARLSPQQRPELARSFLLSAALLIQRHAAEDTIIRGGKGPPHPTRLTSRTGTGRRSISVDRSGLPSFIAVGSDLGYMALHETGGTVHMPATEVSESTRSVAFGRRVAPFKVPAHLRRGHFALYPPRPWLAPAVDLSYPEIVALGDRLIADALADA